MNASIVITVLDSHKAVCRQLRHFAFMPLPEDVELILVDDGSDPPLTEFVEQLQHKPGSLRILRHDIDAEWTQPAARNYGCREAKGEWLILTDIDHIITEPLIKDVLKGHYDCAMFRREVAVLDEHGRFIQDEETVLEYGFQRWRLESEGYGIARHVNSFGIRRKLYLELGGSNEHRVGTGKYPNNDDGRLRHRLKQASLRGDIRYCPDGEGLAVLYMFPNGKYAGDVDHNPFGLFHNLSRKNDENRQWRMQQAGRFSRSS